MAGQKPSGEESPQDRERKLIQAAWQQEYASDLPESLNSNLDSADLVDPSSVGEDITIAHVGASLLNSLAEPLSDDMDPQKLRGGPRYQMLELLGKGGMGEVYKALDRRLGRVVAMKRIGKMLASSPRSLERFLAEAKAVAALNHYNIVQVYDIDEDDHGHFITMEYVEGEDLKSKLDRDGKFDPERAVEIVRQLCDALNAAHARGIIHRDIKPGNILINMQGTPKLVDFGLAHVAEDSGPSLTRTGAVMGTIAYASPEQLADSKNIDVRADIYSLGVTLYEMLTGLSPQRIDELKLPEELRPCVMKAIAHDREDRYASVEAFGWALNQIVLGDVDSLIRKAEVCNQSGDLEGALQRYERVLRINAGHTHARQQVALIQSAIDGIRKTRQIAQEAMQRGDWNAAAEAWKRILDEAPGDLEAIQQHARAVGEVRNHTLVAAIEETRRLLEGDDPLGAEAQCEIASGIDPNNREVAELQVAVHAAKRRLRNHKIRAGTEAFREKDYPASIVLLTEALGLMRSDHPDRAKLIEGCNLAQASQWIMEADQAIEAGDMLEAEELLRQAEAKAGSVRNVVKRIESRRNRIQAWQAVTAKRGWKTGLLIGVPAAVVLLVAVVAIPFFRSSEKPRPVTVASPATQPIITPSVVQLEPKPIPIPVVAHPEPVNSPVRPQATQIAKAQTRPAAPQPSLRPASQPSGGPLPAENVKIIADASARSSMAASALISQPAKIRGVQSWTIDTRLPRGRLASIAVSPDRRWLAAAGDTGVVRIWDYQTGRLFRALLGHDWLVLALAWSPDSKHLMSCGRSCPPRLWEVETGKMLPLYMPDLSSSADNDAECSPDGKRYAVSDDSLYLIDQKTMTLERTIKHARGGGIHKLSWSPDSTMVAVLVSQEICLYSADTGEVIRQFEIPKGLGRGICWSPDGTMLASIVEPETVVRIWDSHSGKPVRLLEGHTIWASSLVWSPDGKYCAAGAIDGRVRVWEVGTGREIRKMSDHNDAVTQLIWLPGGELLSIGVDANLRWYYEADKPARTITGYREELYSISRSRDGKYFAVAGGWTIDRGAIQIWDLEKTICMKTLHGHTEGPVVAFSTHDSLLASVSLDQSLRVWNIPSGNELWRVEKLGSRLTGIAWSPDGQQYATGSIEGIVRLWDHRNRKLRHTLQAPSNPVRDLHWSADGKTLACVPARGPVHIWDAVSGQTIKTIATPSYREKLDGSWSIDGKRIYVGGLDKAWSVLDADTGQVVDSIPVNYPNSVTDMAMSPDGRFLCATGWYRTLHLLDAKTYKSIHTWMEHSYNVGGVSWAPDSKSFISIGSCSEARFWDVDRDCSFGAIIAPLPTQWAAFSSDGHYRATRALEADLIYIVQTEKGQETLTPAEFARKYGWKNDPSRVRLSSPPAGNRKDAS